MLAAVLAVLASNARDCMAQTLSTNGRPYELFAIEATGGTPRRIVETPTHTCGSPDWSPDGKLIAFDTWRLGKSYDASMIALIRPDGTERRVLGPGGMPSWSPDGSQIACHTYDTPQTIVVIDAHGAGRETIINHWGCPRWSPRGNLILSLNTRSQILLFDPIAGNERAMLPDKSNGIGYYAAQIGFGISPDGTQICFGSSNDGLFLATLNEQTSQCSLACLVKGGTVRHCTWSPDAKRVAFGYKQGRNDLEQIYVYDFETSTSVQLPGLDPQRNNCCPDWSPDGKTIAFVSQHPGDPR